MPIHAINAAGRLPFLVMPYLACESLQQRISREGPLNVVDVLRVARQTASALAAAHAQGLVHRDVKPANILLEKGVDRVLLTDFGLARAVDDASLTRTGVIAGTPQYMSPEQSRGETIDHRTDLFSLGSVLYAMCTGRPPFRAESTYGMLRRICEASPHPLREINPDVPPWLATIIERLLAKEPSQRFQTAAAVADLLEQCLAHVQQPAAAPLPESLREPAAGARSVWQSLLRRRSVWIAPPVLAVIATVAVIVSGLFQPDGDDNAPATGKAPAAGMQSSAERTPDGEPSGAVRWEDGLDDQLRQIDEELQRLEERAARLWDSDPSPP
jgi:eukaryotic-like serine/threonine-protein kinase